MSWARKKRRTVERKTGKMKTATARLQVRSWLIRMAAIVVPTAGGCSVSVDTIAKVDTVIDLQR